MFKEISKVDIYFCVHEDICQEPKLVALRFQKFSFGDVLISIHIR
jgi:hypothetical protein